MHTVAVDILTGFLGSGKTTLLRHVLDHGLRGKPVAVIMNEIGEIGIDGRVITGLSAVETDGRAVERLHLLHDRRLSLRPGGAGDRRDRPARI